MTTEKYRELRSCGFALNEKLDCAVIAWSVLTGMPYEDSLAVIATETGRKPGGRTPNNKMASAYEKYGYILKEVLVSSRSIRALEKELTVGEYLVFIQRRRHVLAIVDGIVHDWTRGRLNRPYEVFEVKKT